MQVKIFRVTGRLRLGPGDTVMLSVSDKETISELQHLGVIEAEPMQTLEVQVQPTKRKKEEE
jgi:hypothetical protein